jgi:hypothetical protein
MFASETFSKEWKLENNLVLSHLAGSHKSLALRETAQPVPENLGVHVQCTTSECLRYEKMGKRESDSCAAKKSAKKLGSSDCTKNLE